MDVQLLRLTVKGSLPRERRQCMSKGLEGRFGVEFKDKGHIAVIHLEQQAWALAHRSPQMMPRFGVFEDQQRVWHCTNTSIVNSHKLFLFMKIRNRLEEYTLARDNTSSFKVMLSTALRQ